jgi:hypothetical protein
MALSASCLRVFSPAYVAQTDPSILIPQITATMWRFTISSPAIDEDYPALIDIPGPFAFINRTPGYYAVRIA